MISSDKRIKEISNKVVISSPSIKISSFTNGFGQEAPELERNKFRFLDEQTASKNTFEKLEWRKIKTTNNIPDISQMEKDFMDSDSEEILMSPSQKFRTPQVKFVDKVSSKMRNEIEFVNNREVLARTYDIFNSDERIKNEVKEKYIPRKLGNSNKFPNLRLFGEEEIVKAESPTIQLEISKSYAFESIVSEITPFELFSENNVETKIDPEIKTLNKNIITQSNNSSHLNLDDIDAMSFDEGISDFKKILNPNNITGTYLGDIFSKRSGKNIVFCSQIRNDFKKINLFANKSSRYGRDLLKKNEICSSCLFKEKSKHSKKRIINKRKYVSNRMKFEQENSKFRKLSKKNIQRTCNCLSKKQIQYPSTLYRKKSFSMNKLPEISLMDSNFSNLDLKELKLSSKDFGDFELSKVLLK